MSAWIKIYSKRCTTTPWCIANTLLTRQIASKMHQSRKRPSNGRPLSRCRWAFAPLSLSVRLPLTFYDTDNTNANTETRAYWIEVAKELKIPIRCIYFTSPPNLCRHNDAVRASNPSLVSLPPSLFTSSFSFFILISGGIESRITHPPPRNRLCGFRAQICRTHPWGRVWGYYACRLSVWRGWGLEEGLGPVLGLISHNPLSQYSQQ